MVERRASSKPVDVALGPFAAANSIVGSEQLVRVLKSKTSS